MIRLSENGISAKKSYYTKNVLPFFRPETSIVVWWADTQEWLTAQTLPLLYDTTQMSSSWRNILLADSGMTRNICMVSKICVASATEILQEFEFNDKLITAHYWNWRPPHSEELILDGERDQQHRSHRLLKVGKVSLVKLRVVRYES